MKLNYYPETDSLYIVSQSEPVLKVEKYRKISNLLTNMRRSGRIYNAGSRKVPEWRLLK